MSVPGVRTARRMGRYDLACGVDSPVIPGVRQMEGRKDEMPRITRIIPLLVYEDIPAAHDFLVKAFGFTPGGVKHNTDGRPIHAEVYAGDLTIWIHRVTADHDLASQRSMGAASSGLVVHVDDVDAHYERALAYGAHIEREPQDAAYGQREYSVRDPEGHRWWFATPLTQSAGKSV